MNNWTKELREPTIKEALEFAMAQAAYNPHKAPGTNDCLGVLRAHIRAIAAAPLMYEALQDAINWHGLDGDGISDPTLSKLQAALDAAGGTDGK